MLLIREETPADYAAIGEINRLAFGGELEAALINRLRGDGLVVASLVALEDAGVVGHILFSDLPIETSGGMIPGVSLAPMAVTPGWQRRGIGSALVREGLDVCRRRGKSAAVVLGHPAFYPRFGFSSELARRLRGPYSGDAWMALALTPGVLDAVEGRVRYPPAFSLVDH